MIPPPIHFFLHLPNHHLSNPCIHHLFIHHQSIMYPSIDPFIHSPSHSPAYPSIYQPTHPLTRVSIYPPIIYHPFTHLLFILHQYSTHPFCLPSTHPIIPLFIHHSPSTSLCTHSSATKHSLSVSLLADTRNFSFSPYIPLRQVLPLLLLWTCWKTEAQ